MRGFSRLDNPNHKGQTNVWLTPLWLVKKLGTFDLDPCGYPGHFTAKELYCETDRDGLAEDWFGRVWLNPPYGNEIGFWLDRLQIHGNGIALVFARTETNWFQRLNPDLIFLLKGRIKFLRPDYSEGSNAGHGSMLLAFGGRNVESVLNSGIEGMALFK